MCVGGWARRLVALIRPDDPRMCQRPAAPGLRRAVSLLCISHDTYCCTSGREYVELCVYLRLGMYVCVKMCVKVWEHMCVYMW